MSTVTKYFILLALAIPLLFLFGCKNNSGFVYYVKNNDVNNTYKIKDIVGNGKLDMLWVIDNSGSMGTYQTSVAANTDVFIKALEGSKALDWRLSMISTDVKDAPYIEMDAGKYLTSSTPDFANKFRAAVSRLGTSGDGYERTYEPIVSALKNNPGFLRLDATFAIILVSDAPEQSKTTTKEFIDAIKIAKGSLKNVLFYGVLCPTEWCSSTDDSWAWAGSKFEELAAGLKGKFYPICDTNFSKNLVSIGSDIASQISSSRILLKSRPKIKTISVVYQNQILPGGDKDSGGYWHYDLDLNAIVFNDLSFAPNDMEEVSITYIEANGSE